MEDTRTCFDISVQECVENCPHETIHCNVRLLRETVMGNEPLAELVEYALDEHWRDAFQTGLKHKSESYENSLEMELV